MLDLYYTASGTAKIISYTLHNIDYRHGVIVINNCNQLQLITGFLVIAIAIVILVSKCHVIAIPIKFTAKVIAISDYFMITVFG